MGNESFQGDFLFDLNKQTAAAEHHALQDSQRHLLDRRVQNLRIHKTGDLKNKHKSADKIVIGNYVTMQMQKSLEMRFTFCKIYLIVWGSYNASQYKHRHVWRCILFYPEGVL